MAVVNHRVASSKLFKSLVFSSNGVSCNEVHLSLKGRVNRRERDRGKIFSSVNLV